MVNYIINILELITILFAIFGVIVLVLSLFFFARISKNHVKRILDENDSVPLEEQSL